MNQLLAYQVMRTLSAAHRLQRSEIQFRYDDVSSITAGAIRSAAAAALKKSALQRQLDLKSLCDKPTPEAVEAEAKLLKKLSDSGEDIDAPMQELIDFYGSLRGGKAH